MLSVTVKSSFANQGQICLCGSRIYVEETIFEQFKKDFVAKVAALKVGNPFDIDTNIGALVSKSHMEKVQSYIEIAKQENGTILYGTIFMNYKYKLKMITFENIFYKNTGKKNHFTFLLYFIDFKKIIHLNR